MHKFKNKDNGNTNNNKKKLTFYENILMKGTW